MRDVAGIRKHVIDVSAEPYMLVFTAGTVINSLEGNTGITYSRLCIPTDSIVAMDLNPKMAVIVCPNDYIYYLDPSNTDIENLEDEITEAWVNALNPKPGVYCES